MIVQKSPLKRVFPVLAHVAALAVTGYFAWSAWHGDRGLVAREHYESQIAERRDRLAALEAETAIWRARVAMLEPRHIDRDLLEERAAILLNAAHPNDLVVLFD
jgi:cell division protein FtsB